MEDLLEAVAIRKQTIRQEEPSLSAIGVQDLGLQADAWLAEGLWLGMDF